MFIEEHAPMSSSIRSFCWHAMDILCSAQTLALLLVLLQRKNKFVLISITKMFYM
jgi:hypothetical protein